MGNPPLLLRRLLEGLLVLRLAPEHRVPDPGLELAVRRRRRPSEAEALQREVRIQLQPALDTTPKGKLAAPAERNTNQNDELQTSLKRTGTAVNTQQVVINNNK